MNQQLPEPKRYLKANQPIYGLLEHYETEPTQYGKALVLSVRDEKNVLHKVSIKISGGQTYATTYAMLKEHDLPFGVDISASDAMNGRTIKYVKKLKPKSD